jgi:protein TonB
LSCTIAAQGNLANCVVVSETPDGFGFGEAALKGAQNARLRARTIDGAPLDGRPVQFRSKFSLD